MGGGVKVCVGFNLSLLLSFSICHMCTCKWSSCRVWNYFPRLRVYRVLSSLTQQVFHHVFDCGQNSSTTHNPGPNMCLSGVAAAYIGLHWKAKHSKGNLGVKILSETCNTVVSVPTGDLWFNPFPPSLPVVTLYCLFKRLFLLVSLLLFDCWTFRSTLVL